MEDLSFDEALDVGLVLCGGLSSDLLDIFSDAASARDRLLSFREKDCDNPYCALLHLDSVNLHTGRRAVCDSNCKRHRILGSGIYLRPLAVKDISDEVGREYSGS